MCIFHMYQLCCSWLGEADICSHFQDSNPIGIKCICNSSLQMYSMEEVIGMLHLSQYSSLVYIMYSFLNHQLSSNKLVSSHSSYQNSKCNHHCNWCIHNSRLISHSSLASKCILSSYSKNIYLHILYIFYSYQLKHN